MKLNWDEYYFPNEMMEQADAIENCMKELTGRLNELAKLGKDVERVYIVGSGDCYFIGFAAAHAFRNLQILIHEGQWAMVSKGKSPAIHFVIRHPKLRTAIERFVPPVVEVE